jgi:hypothetical protein
MSTANLNELNFDENDDGKKRKKATEIFFDLEEKKKHVKHTENLYCFSSNKKSNKNKTIINLDSATEVHRHTSAYLQVLSGDEACCPMTKFCPGGNHIINHFTKKGCNTDLNAAMDWVRICREKTLNKSKDELYKFMTCEYIRCREGAMTVCSKPGESGSEVTVDRMNYNINGIKLCRYVTITLLAI